MIESYTTLRTETLAHAHHAEPRTLRATGPYLPRPRNRLKERLLDILRPARAGTRGCGECY